MVIMDSINKTSLCGLCSSSSLSQVGLMMYFLLYGANPAQPWCYDNVETYPVMKLPLKKEKQTFKIIRKEARN